MNYNTTHDALAEAKTDCLLVGVFTDGSLCPSAQILDEASDGYIRKILNRADIKGKVGQTLLLHEIPQIASPRVLIVGCGEKDSTKEKQFTKINETAINAIKSLNVFTALSCLHHLNVEGRDLGWRITQSILAIEKALYKINDMKSQKAEDNHSNLESLSFIVANPAIAKHVTAAIDAGQAISAGIRYTKDLGNTAPNICTPTYLAEEAKKLAKQYPEIKCKVLEESDMKKLGMGCFLSVSQGSEQPGKLITLDYRGGNANDKPIALVGKGISFDTGGISLKPREAMIGMKYDMCGAATVLGVIKALAEMELPINVVGVVASAENMPGGKASKPEDIVTSMSGQTVEILNTDAEGRLVLCDALTYTQKTFEPNTIIDIATLTGACMVALGTEATGLMSNNDALANELTTAGDESLDRVWRLPIWEEYDKLIDSPFADMQNIGGKWAGTITAACFLARFCKNVAWAHLDVAGTASSEEGGRHATGRPVTLLMQYLLNQVHH